MKKRSKAKKAARRKQPDLPEMNGDGVALPQIPELDEMAAEYVAKRDERMALLKQEVDAKKRMKLGMDKHGLKHYPLDDETRIVIKPGPEIIKVEKIKSVEVTGDGAAIEEDNDNE